MRKYGLSVAVAAVVLAVGASLRSGCLCSVSKRAERTAAAEKSAVPAKLKPPGPEPLIAPGLPNFYRVTEDLCRSAQPTAEGMRQLEAMGIKTVVNLRSFHSDRDEIRGTGLAYEHILMQAWYPEDEDVVRFLKIVTDGARTPVLVHCKYGADRTGLMCAIYRVVVCGWSKEEAISEMTQERFGFHGIWDNLIEYVRALDVEEIKRRAGIEDKRRGKAPVQDCPEETTDTAPASNRRGGSPSGMRAWSIETAERENER